MFLLNKYTIWYTNIVDNAFVRSLPDDVYTEVHHIIPRSMGGNDSEENLVKLTAREHFICHALLTKIVPPDHKKKMNYAFWRMANSGSFGKRYTPSSRMYEFAKKQFIISMQGHPNYLLFQKSESKERISISMKETLSKLTPEEKYERIKRSCSSPSSWTLERKEKISKALTGITRSAETRAKMSLAKQHLTVEQKLKCGDSNRGKTWKLVNGKRVWIDKEQKNYTQT